jgi:hypothetical protein
MKLFKYVGIGQLQLGKQLLDEGEDTRPQEVVQEVDDGLGRSRAYAKRLDAPHHGWLVFFTDVGS